MQAPLGLRCQITDRSRHLQGNLPSNPDTTPKRCRAYRTSPKHSVAYYPLDDVCRHNYPGTNRNRLSPIHHLQNCTSSSSQHDRHTPTLLRQTIGKRMRAKLAELKSELRRRLHHSVPSVGRWLRSVVQGHFQYYAVPRNQRKLDAFKYQVYRLWLQSLRRRGQRHRITGGRMNRLAAKRLPPVRTLHPYPEQRLRVIT